MPASRNRPRRQSTFLAPAGLALALLSGCGGGGGGSAGSDAPAAGTPPAVPLMQVSGVVADGPLQGARVCLDTNDNGSCEAEEPTSSVTDSEGRYTLQVPQGLMGRHALVAAVPATAVDKDNPGQVLGTAYALRAPPTTANTVFVSPLTTLVADAAVRARISPAEADRVVQQQLGMTNSPLSDFVSSSDAQAARLARTVNTVIVEVTKLAVARGLPADQTQALVRSAAGDDLPLLAARVQAASLHTGTGTTAQLLAVARDAAAGVLADRNINASTVAVQAEIAKALSAGSTAEVPAGFETTVRRFAYADAANYSIHLNSGNPAATNAAGEYDVNEIRVGVAGGVSQAFNRNQAWWTGSQWLVCDNGWRIVKVTAQTATEPQKSLFCGAGRSESRIVTKDIGGRRMADVIAEFRAFPLRDNDGFLPTNWGPNPDLLSDAVFPAGAQMTTRQSISELGGADLLVLGSKPVLQFTDADSGLTVSRNAARLEEFSAAAGAHGAPSVRVASATMAFVDEMPLTPSAGSPATLERYFAAFNAAVSEVRFYRCKMLSATDIEASCETLGTGTTAISTQGDARIMRVTGGYPIELTARMKRQRTWIERDGVVFYGQHLLPNLHHSQRLNGVAWTALRTRLSIPAHTEPQAPDPLAAFRWITASFSFRDDANYRYRSVGRTQALVAGTDNVLDDVTTLVRAGVLTPLSQSSEVWTGTEWRLCDAHAPGALTFNPTTGEQVRCGASRSIWRETRVQLDGRNLADVVREIRWYPGLQNWGPDPNVFAARLAGVKMPAGAALGYSTIRFTGEGLSISVDDGMRLRVPPDLTNSDPGTWPTATSLESMIVAYPGTLALAPLSANVTLLIASDYAAAPIPVGNTSERQYRVSFDPVGNRATFWRAAVRTSDGAPTDFVAIESTTFSFDSVGGRRILRFARTPAALEALHGQPVFVEKQGAVWPSSAMDVSTLPPAATVRLNGPAWEVLRQALGITTP